MLLSRTLFTASSIGPSWNERDRSIGPPQGRCAPAFAGRLRRPLPRPAAAEHFAVGEPGSIVDADVQVFPADDGPVASVAGDAVPDPFDAAEFFDVDMDQFAGRWR